MLVAQTLIKVISDATKLPYNVDVFLNTLLFDALIGNHDRHSRNLAFIVTPPKISLSPIYNNVSYLNLVTVPMLAADFNPTGRIATQETQEPLMMHYVLELKRLGHQNLLKSFLNKVKMPKIEQLINKSFCSDFMKKALKKIDQKKI